MPGRLPKDPSVRQRTNKTSTRAVLYKLRPDEVNVPPMPPNVRYREDEFGADCPTEFEVPWSSTAKRYWERIWASPMASEFHGMSDIEGLYRLLALVELFWRRPNASLNAEIRLYEQQFGLNPLARRRLEWQIVDTEKAQEARDERAERKASRAPKPVAVPDNGSPVDPLSA